jgi:hypothetical protein
VAYTLRTGQKWEADWLLDATRQAEANGATFGRLGSFDGLARNGEPIPETAAERRARLDANPRRRRVTKADKAAVERALAARKGV